MKTTINWKRGGRLVVVIVVDLGGKGGVSLPLCHRCLQAGRRQCGAERGVEDDNDNFIVVVEGRGKRLGGKGGRGATDDGERGARCHLCRSCRLRSRFCQPPPPSGVEGDVQRHAGVVGG